MFKNGFSTVKLIAWVAAIATFVSMTFSLATTHTINVLNLPQLDDWEPEVFVGETRYELVEIDNRQALQAISHQSASGLIRRMEVDLTKTPYMNWSWKVPTVLSGVDEKTKPGDDYAARVYVVISTGFFIWQTRAISYVWASKEAKNSTWPNAFVDKALMVAVESGEELTGQWVMEKRNILDDIQNLLGIEQTQINAVAIMTDTDNSQQSAIAYYGDIYFSAK